MCHCSWGFCCCIDGDFRPRGQSIKMFMGPQQAQQMYPKLYCTYPEFNSFLQVPAINMQRTTKRGRRERELKCCWLPQEVDYSLFSF